MTQGTFKRCSNDANAVFFDGYTVIDGVSVHIESGATAGMYWYTPHFPGNLSFYNLFSGWFGNPNSPCTATANISGATSGSKVISYQYSSSSPTNLAFIQQNGTGSSCAEAHVWNSGYQNWLTHIATGMKATDPSMGSLVAMNSAGDKRSGLAYVLYSGAGGAAEVHKLSPDLLTFPGYYDVPTNLSGVSATSGTFVAGDLVSRGYDQLAYVLYGGSGGKVETHTFTQDLRRATGFQDIATNLPSFDPSQ